MPPNIPAPAPGIASLNDIARRYIAEKQREPDAFYRAKWTAAKREAYFKAHPENFAGPDASYPIEDASDINDAARLAGHSDNPDAVRRKIVEIAKRLGFTDALPASWKKEDMPRKPKAPQRAATPDLDGRTADELIDDTTGVNDPDEGDEHKELIDDLDSTEGDNEDEPRNAPEATIERTIPAPEVSYYAPITRINKEKREVIGTATAEVKDAYRTVIGYEASKDAFHRWRGNIREMHDPKKAVGRALEIIPDDEHRRIIVRARISKGAEDTWQKILDGTLTGFSIGGKNGKWTKRIIDGEELDYLDRYDQAELSVVDNPACPASHIEVVRADGMVSDILAKDDEIEQKPAKPQPQNETVERAGARISAETRDAMHDMRDHALTTAKKAMETCGCDDCMDMANKVAENDDNDGDMDAPAAMRRLIADIVRAEISEALRSSIAPTMQRVNALLASDASRGESPEISRRVDDITSQIAAIKEIVERIEAQPADGGPILHGAPIDKRLATQGSPTRGTDADAIQRAMELGFAPPSDPQEQIKAAAKLFRPIPR